MWDLGWYGVPPEDAVPGQDPRTGSASDGYGNWWLNGAAYTASDPVTYPGVPYSVVDPALCADYYGARARQIASYFRPLVGVYSSSGQDAMSLAKHDLDLSLLRRSGDPRGRCTAWACEVGHLRETVAGGTNPGDVGWHLQADLRYKNLASKLARAEADATLGPCITIAYNGGRVASQGYYQDEADEQAAISQDIQDYVALLAASPKALRVKNGAYDATGRLVLFLWIGTDTLYTPAQWDALLDDARTASGEDFYIASRYRGGGAFNYSDAVWPWSGNADYASATGATERLKAADWTRLRMDQIKKEAATAGTDRVAMGSLFPGFEDWGRGFGQGLDRDIPRSEDLVQGQIDRYITDTITALQVGTWNDYPEGTQWEPTVERTQGLTVPSDASAAEELEWLTEQVGRLYSETVSSTDTAALKAIWTDYGDQRACAAAPLATGVAMATPEAAGEAAVERKAGAANTQSITAGDASVGRSGGVASNPEPAGAAGVKRWQS